MKAGSNRTTKVEDHDHAFRIAGSGTHLDAPAHRARILLEQFAIPRDCRGIRECVGGLAFHLDRGHFVLKSSRANTRLQWQASEIKRSHGASKACEEARSCATGIGPRCFARLRSNSRLARRGGIAVLLGNAISELHGSHRSRVQFGATRPAPVSATARETALSRLARASQGQRP